MLLIIITSLVIINMAKRTLTNKTGFHTKSSKTSNHFFTSRQKRSIIRFIIAVLVVLCFILSDEDTRLPKRVIPLNEKTKILIVSEYRAGGDALAEIFNKHANTVYFREPFWMLIKENITDYCTEEETEQGIQLIQSFFK